MLKHYVEYERAGLFFAEHAIKEIASRDIDAAIVLAPDDAYAFRFADRTEIEADGEALRGYLKDQSDLYFMGGELYDIERVALEMPTDEILLSNMQLNGWNQVVRTSVGTFWPFPAGSVLLQLNEDRRVVGSVKGE